MNDRLPIAKIINTDSIALIEPSWLMGSVGLLIIKPLNLIRMNRLMPFSVVNMSAIINNWKLTREHFTRLKITLFSWDYIFHWFQHG